MQAVTFGDRPSGAIAVTALRKTAVLFRECHREAADIIMNNSYVDDILHSTDSVSKAQLVAKEINTVLAEGHFFVKQWTFSGQDRHPNLENLRITDGEERVLGMTWEPRGDVFKCKAHLNFSRRIKKIHTQENLKKDDLPHKIPEILTHIEWYWVN